MIDLERINTCYIERGEQLQFTFADDWYSITSERNQPSAFLTPVFVDGDMQLLHQYVHQPLLEILMENELLKQGKEVEISRSDDEHGHYQVTWLEEGERKTTEARVQTRP